MPKQVVILEVSYMPLDHEGSINTPPHQWPWEDMADHFEECVEPSEMRTDTHSVRVISYAPVEEDPQDEKAAEAWHETNCNDGCDWKGCDNK